MGRWGPGNLDDDSACDVLAGYCSDLIKRTVSLAGSQLAAEFDEYDHAQLFCHFEIIFALAEKDMLSGLPEPEEVATVRDLFLKRFDKYSRQDPYPERRKVIVDTFERFHKLCIDEAEAPGFQIVEPPSVSEIAPSLVLQEVPIFDRSVTLELPSHWDFVSYSGQLAPGPNHLVDLVSDSHPSMIRLRKEHFHVVASFRASGSSLRPDMVSPDHFPSILLTLLQAEDEEPYINVHDIATDVDERLAKNDSLFSVGVGLVTWLENAKADLHGVEIIDASLPDWQEWHRWTSPTTS